MSHVVHPSFDRDSWPADLLSGDVHFFRDRLDAPMPTADLKLLASLERPPVPTIHNMVMSDRLTAKLPYEEVMAYASLVAQRLLHLCEKVRPTLIIGSFDGIHNSLGLAVATRLGIPWFTPLFSPLPGDEAAFCSNLSPASRVQFDAQRAAGLQEKAETLLAEFECRKLAALAYVPPKLFSLGFVVKQIPRQWSAFMAVWRRRHLRRFVQFTDFPQAYSLRAFLGIAARHRKNIWQLGRRRFVTAPPQTPFVFFGLHMQPESSIDVFAHFFSNQERVIELLARSLPPTHALMVKLHKSDTPNYSSEQLERLARFPGVQLVSPYADTIGFIKRADLIVAIQGTIGLEGALLGKPVVMFGDSPAKVFPNVTTAGKTIELPQLLRSKLSEVPPNRTQITAAFAEYLAPFYPASGNDWRVAPTDAQIDDYIAFMHRLLSHATATANRGAA